ncbi:MAG: hypothetical protein B7733_23550 [Myxococcales bacterium FL481]|nr:MAG: hypothetical protein B7733_23550 [Myxococcales bacterium FL481]
MNQLVGPLVALWLLVVGREGGDTVAVVADPTIVAHQSAADALADRLPGRAVVLSSGQRWESSQAPRVVVAIGDPSEREAAARWPDTPRASLLLWDEPIAAPTSHLLISARMDPVCTAAALQGRDGVGWLVLASPSDDGAVVLAQRLQAPLWQGTAQQLQRRLQSGGLTTPTTVWLRSDPALAVPTWLSYLGAMTRLPEFQLGSDAAGFRRFGIGHWVAPDLDALTLATSRWVTRQLRRPRGKRVRHALPCRRVQ